MTDLQLDESSVPADPIELLQQWFDEARLGLNAVPEAMALATADAAGAPAVRFVLLEDVDRRGLTFFTNYESHKAQQLEVNPKAAAAIFWAEPRRQVRVEGAVRKLSVQESDAYFQTRDRASQTAAWASPQDAVLANRAVLEARVAQLTKEYEGRDVPRPPFWGGYLLTPHMLEFWSGRESRLHDRIRYDQLPDGMWSIRRIAP